MMSDDDDDDDDYDDDDDDDAGDNDDIYLYRDSITGDFTAQPTEVLGPLRYDQIQLPCAALSALPIYCCWESSNISCAKSIPTEVVVLKHVWKNMEQIMVQMKYAKCIYRS